MYLVSSVELKNQVFMGLKHVERYTKVPPAPVYGGLCLDIKLQQH